MIVHGVQPEELDELFDGIYPWLFRIPRLLEKYTVHDILTEIERGNWQLWIFIGDGIDGVLLTTIVQFPLLRELQLLGVAGRHMKEWIEHMPLIEKYARDNGCGRIVFLGARKGFARLFPDYETRRLVLEKEL